MPRVENETFYKTSLKKHGLTSRALHWNSDQSQKLRFEVLLSLLPEKLSGCKIVDAGCGFGDLYSFMNPKPLQYIGIDLMDTMVEEAKKRTGCEIVKKDICYDELPQTDYYFCSGSMNILQKFETYLFIQNCFRASKKGFIFNILEGDDESLVYNYFREDELKEVAKKLGAKIEIKRGYMHKDISVGLFH
jgi:SAM-dependent methyltransferase